MAAKITAKYDGEGFLDDPGHDGSPDGPIAAGVPFEVTKQRFDELVAQGIALSKVKPGSAAAAVVDAGEPTAEAAS